jgi:hypothetical protein
MGAVLVRRCSNVSRMLQHSQTCRSVRPGTFVNGRAQNLNRAFHLREWSHCRLRLSYAALTCPGLSRPRSGLPGNLGRGVGGVVAAVKCRCPLSLAAARWPRYKSFLPDSERYCGGYRDHGHGPRPTPRVRSHDGIVMCRARRVDGVSGTAGASHVAPMTLSTRCSSSALGIDSWRERPSVAPTSLVSAAFLVHIEQSGMCAATGDASPGCRACNAHPTASSRCGQHATPCWLFTGLSPSPGEPR